MDNYIGFYLSLAVALLVVMVIGSGIKIVPQGKAFLVQRLGKYRTTLMPGLHFIVPFIDSAVARVSQKDITLDVPEQEVITKDNAVVRCNAIAFIRIHTPHKAIYGIDNYSVAVRNLVMTNIRNIIGQIDLDDALSSRDQIKARVIDATANDVGDWGLTIKNVEIQKLDPSPTMQQAMEQQAAAERSRRAAITEADGQKNAAILEAQGQKEAAIQKAEGELEASRREAEARRILAEATRDAIKRVEEGLGSNQLPAMYLLGEKYIAAMQELSTSENSKSIILPADLPAAIKNAFGFFGSAK